MSKCARVRREVPRLHYRYSTRDLCISLSHTHTLSITPCVYLWLYLGGIFVCFLPPLSFHHLHSCQRDPHLSVYAHYPLSPCLESIITQHTGRGMLNECILEPIDKSSDTGTDNVPVDTDSAPRIVRFSVPELNHDTCGSVGGRLGVEDTDLVVNQLDARHMRMRREQRIFQGVCQCINGTTAVTDFQRVLVHEWRINRLVGLWKEGSGVG